MEPIDSLRQFENIPFGHENLMGLLSNYRAPNDKISSLLAKRDILPIKRGLYVLSDRHRSRPVSRELISNLLYGPSYISLDYALAWHGLIPEAAAEVTAVTVKRARIYETLFGIFSYTQSHPPYYGTGIYSESNRDGTSFLMATIEKALCDKIVFTPGLRIHSTQAMAVYLEESLRIDLNELRGLSVGILESCLKAGRKTQQLGALLKLIKQLP